MASAPPRLWPTSMIDSSLLFLSGSGAGDGGVGSDEAEEEEECGKDWLYLDAKIPSSDTISSLSVSTDKSPSSLVCVPP